MSKAAAIIDKAIAEGKAAAEPEPMAATVPADSIGPGHNKPPADMLLQADDLLARFAEIYQPTQESVTKLLADIGGRTDGVIGAPDVIADESGNGVIAAYMESLRTTIKTVDAHREREKAPYLKAERAAQGYFAAMLTRLEKTRDILQARGNAWVAKKAAIERQRLAKEAEDARKKAADDAEAARVAQDAADELERAAARARKPENIAKLEDAAEAKGAEAGALTAMATVAADQAAAATMDAAAPTADLVRERFDTGHMSTGKQVGYVEVEDYSKLDLNVLRPYFKIAEIERALGAWAKTQDYKCQMEGADIGKRDAAVYR